MKDLKQRLVDADPIAREPGMSDADVQAMRQTIVVEARRRPEPAPAPALWWPRPLALTAALAACLVLGIGIGMRLSSDVPLSSSRPVATPTRDVRRQLQMTSPGGTRIIWTFHEKLEL
jgi:hypothetical protein